MFEWVSHEFVAERKFLIALRSSQQILKMFEKILRMCIFGEFKISSQKHLKKYIYLKVLLITICPNN
jgi:hypothetical protein